jgi:hypothetical protein
MSVLALLLLLAQGVPDATAMLRGKAVEELKAERLESAQVLLSIASWLKPGGDLEALEQDTARKLRAAKSLRHGAIDLSAFSDSIYDGYVVHWTGTTSALRTAKNSSLTLTIDGEQFVIRGTALTRRRKKPGEVEAGRVVVVSDDETLVIEDHAFSIVERKPPGALAGRLLASKDAREQEAGAMIYSIKSVIHALEHLNEQRLAAGVAPVAFSAALSRACHLHARYLANEDPKKVVGLLAHEENQESPWYTPEGAVAGKQSCITSLNMDCAVAPLLATLYHRVPMMDPDLVRVGIAQAEKDFRYFSVLDVLSAHEDAPRRPVMLPSDGQTSVPLRFANGESPDPRPKGAAEIVGYPITLSWYGGGEATAVLKSLRGGDVECWVSTPKSPANEARPDNASSVCLLPKKPLSHATKYAVTVTAGEHTWSWFFTTK